MRLTLTPLAEQDLEVIGDYIADDNPTRAVSFIREMNPTSAASPGPMEAQFWPNLQTRYDVVCDEEALHDRLDKEVTPTQPDARRNRAPILKPAPGRRAPPPSAPLPLCASARAPRLPA